MQDLTNVTVHFLKQPSETRWIAMKYVAVRVLDQYPRQGIFSEISQGKKF